MKVRKVASKSVEFEEFHFGVVVAISKVEFFHRPKVKSQEWRARCCTRVSLNVSFGISDVGLKFKAIAAPIQNERQFQEILHFCGPRREN